jgi:hypothetical protein
MYEIIYLSELYDTPSLTIKAGYINQDKKASANAHIAALADAQKVLLFFEAKTPNMLFTLRSYERYQHVMNHLFCLTASPVGPIHAHRDHKLSETALNKANQWVKHELRLLGL